MRPSLRGPHMDDCPGMGSFETSVEAYADKNAEICRLKIELATANAQLANLREEAKDQGHRSNQQRQLRELTKCHTKMKRELAAEKLRDATYDEMARYRWEKSGRPASERPCGSLSTYDTLLVAEQETTAALREQLETERHEAYQHANMREVAERQRDAALAQVTEMQKTLNRARQEARKEVAADLKEVHSDLCRVLTELADAEAREAKLRQGLEYIKKQNGHAYIAKPNVVFKDTIEAANKALAGLTDSDDALERKESM